MGAKDDQKKLGIPERVSVAQRQYEFFRRSKGRLLVRRARESGRRGPTETVDCLVHGSWVPRRLAEGRISSSGWKQLDDADLSKHVRRYLIGDLCGQPIAWGAHPFIRLECTRIGRWVKRPLKGGAGRRVSHKAAQRSRQAYIELLEKGEGSSLDQLEEEARLGFEHQRARISSTEQRANFFLGAAGLTTTLVLANASLLFGDSKLESPWLQLAAATLAVASLCAIIAGLRAIQATMITFDRTPPSSVTLIMERRHLKGELLTRSYLASLLVAQNRASVIGQWKVSHLRDARRWFITATASILVLTSFVLADALV